MTEKIIFSSRLDGVKVVAVYDHDNLLYTETRIEDVDGFGEKVVTVYANGCYEVNTRE